MVLLYRVKKLNVLNWFLFHLLILFQYLCEFQPYLQDQLETSPNLLFADCGNGNDFLESPRNPFLPAGDIKTCSCDRVVGSSFQVLPVVHHLEQVVRSVYDCLRKIDPISHLRDGLEGIYKGSVAGGHRSSVVVDRRS